MATTKVTTNVIADDAVTTAKILDDNVTYAKMQDTSTNNRVLGAATAGTIAEVQVATDMVADDAITYGKMQDTSTANRVLGAVSAGTIGEIQVATDMIADDAVSFEKVDAEFTTSSALSAGATVAVDFDAAQVFTLTPNANTTFNITNPKIGVTKTLIVTGAGSSYTADTWTVGGSSGTFNKIAGTYDDTSSTKNFYQITCVSATEFWYSISQIAT